MRAGSSVGRGVNRGLVGLATGAILAAATTAFAVLPPAESAERVAPAPVIAPTTAVATPVVEPPQAPRSQAAPKPTRSSTPTTAPVKATPKKRVTSCAEAAMDAGRFDPSCDEYQGHLDPGTAAGREPTSGETQFEYGCEQGWIPRSECD